MKGGDEVEDDDIDEDQMEGSIAGCMSFRIGTGILRLSQYAHWQQRETDRRQSYIQINHPQQLHIGSSGASYWL
jgi:hypothetical protein